MSLPRIERSSLSLAFSRSRPSKSTSPEMRAFFCRLSPITVRLETLLPEPDSPTMPSALPRWTSYETPSTAFTIPSSVSKWTVRSRTLRSGSGIADARVDERVENVDDQVGDDDEEGADQHRALDHREVAVLDRVVREAADPRDVEHALGEDRAAEEHADVDPGRGNERRDGAPHAVAQHDAPLAQALRARGADVVLGHRLDQVAAQEPRVDRSERRGEHEPRQYQRPEPLGRVLRQRDVGARPLEDLDFPDVVGEQEQRHEAEPVHRRRYRDQRATHGEAVEEAARPRAGDDADGDPEYQEDHGGAGPERDPGREGAPRTPARPGG